MCRPGAPVNGGNPITPNNFNNFGNFKQLQVTPINFFNNSTFKI